MFKAVLRALLAALALFAAPAAAQQPEPMAIAIGQSWRLASRALGAERVINVWTPPSYAEGDRRYPVVYLIDGGLGQDFHHISGLAQLGALGWLTQDLILVGIETVDRRRELAFPVERDSALRRQYPTAGQSAAFRRHVVDEVKPFIAARYRTAPEAALLGESLAGLFIVETFLKEPASFATYIAIDPSLWWDDGRLAEEAPGLLARHGREPRRLWLSIARETAEQPAHVDRLLAALRARPSPPLMLSDEPRPNLTHATIFHPTAWEALQALYPRPAE